MTHKKTNRISDNPSTAQMKAVLPAVKAASAVAGAFGFFGNEKAAKIKAAADDLLEQAKILDVPDRFNEAFANQGWIATGSFSMTAMHAALDHHANGRADDAQKAIVEWFDEGNISLFCIQRSRRYHDADLRDDQLKEALKLYLEERYMAAVPLILIACDGMASDVAGYSPFKSDADLSCFDSIVGHDSALPALMKKLTTGVRKSSNEPLDLPNRNGILHGRSLGYANKELCAKAWMLLLALVDWASDKASEQERREQFEKEQATTLRDSLDLHTKTQRDKQIIDAFQRSEQSAPFTDLTDPERPETAFIAFFEGWKNKNYGQMAKNAMNPRGESMKRRAGEMRNMAEFVELQDYELVTVRHTTVARAEAIVRVTAKTIRKDVSGTIEVLAFRSKPDGGIAMPLDDGHWCVQQNCIYGVMNEKFKTQGIASQS